MCLISTRERREAERQIFDSSTALPSRVALHLWARNWRHVITRLSALTSRPLKQPHSRSLKTQECYRRAPVVLLRASRSKRRGPGQQPLEVRAKVSALPCFQPDMKLWERLSSTLRSKRTTHLLLFDCPARHNLGWTGEQQTVHVSPPATRTRARLICVNGCVLRPSLEGIKDIFINFLYI